MKFPKPTKRSKPHRPLQRKRPMRKRRARRIDRETPVEKAWKSWVHTRPCVGLLHFNGARPHVCSGPIQQCHVRNHTGASLKPQEFESFAACRLLHDQFDGRDPKGAFEGWTNEQRKTWGLGRAIEARADFHLEFGYPPDPAPPLGEGK